MAKPKLALIPATQGSKLYSVLPADGVGDFTFSRGSAATRINKNGLIETVASGKSRLNYPLIDGVVNGCPSHLLEPSRTNDFTNSEDFSTNWSTSNVLSNVNQIISPNGTLNADLVYENTGTNPHFTFQTVGTTTTNDYTLSVFAKYSGRFLQVFAGGSDTVGNPYVNFDLQNGTFNNNGANGVSMENHGNGWYRCIVEVTSAVTSGFNPIFGLVETLNSSRASGYTGNGTSGVYLWGAMLEEGSYATSYIPTTSSAVTRVAETANGAGDASTFNDSEGVLMAEISALADNGSSRQISLSDGSSSTNKVSLIYTSTSNQLQAFIRSGGSIAFNVSEILSDTTNNNKIALKYKANDFALWVNGIELENNTIGNAPTSLNVLDFDDADGASDFYGSAKQIQYFDSALNDSDLEKITSWTSFTDLANGQTYSIK